MKGYLQLAGSIGLIVFLIVAAALIDRRGYNRGVTDRNAFYEPILRQAADDKIKADQRAEAADARAGQINTDLETQYAQETQDLLGRATAAESRIASLLHQRTTDPPHCGGEVPAIPGSPAGGAGQAASLDRDDRLAAGVSAVGAACEHDADALARWQEWYSRQRSSLNQSITTGETP